MVTHQRCDMMVWYDVIPPDHADTVAVPFVVEVYVLNYWGRRNHYLHGYDTGYTDTDYDTSYDSGYDTDYDTGYDSGDDTG